MAYDDNTDVTSNTFEDMAKSSKKELTIIGSVKQHYDGWMDLLCTECDLALMVVQFNHDNTKIKIICSGCGNEAEIKIEQLLLVGESSGKNKT